MAGNLRVQAGASHTFGPPLIPFAIILIFWGGFLLESSIAHPLESDAASVLSDSFILASGLILAAILLRSVRISSTFEAPEETTCTTVQPAPQGSSPNAKVLPNATPPPRQFHRFYVD